MTDTYDVTNPKRPTIIKDPNAVMDYTFDWTDWLDLVTDTIDSVEIIADGVTLETSQTIGKKVVAWISGGTEGEIHSVTCRITTNSSPVARVEDRTIFLKMEAR